MLTLVHNPEHDIRVGYSIYGGPVVEYTSQIPNAFRLRRTRASVLEHGRRLSIKIDYNPIDSADSPINNLSRIELMQDENPRLTRVIDAYRVSIEEMQEIIAMTRLGTNIILDIDRRKASSASTNKPKINERLTQIQQILNATVISSEVKILPSINEPVQTGLDPEQSAINTNITEEKVDTTRGKLKLSLNNHMAFVSDLEDEIHLTNTEYNYLIALMKEPARVFSWMDLMENSGITDEEILDSDKYYLVKPKLHNLRKKIGDNIIFTIHGYGFSLTPELVSKPEKYRDHLSFFTNIDGDTIIYDRARGHAIVQVGQDEPSKADLIQFSPDENIIIGLLIDNKRRVISNMLFAEKLGVDSLSISNLLKVKINNIRNKIEDYKLTDSPGYRFIQNIRGLGYSLYRSIRR